MIYQSRILHSTAEWQVSFGNLFPASIPFSPLSFDSCSPLSRTSEKRNKRVQKLVQFFAFALPSFCLLFALALPWLCPCFAFALPSLCFVLPYNSVSKRIPSTRFLIASHLTRWGLASCAMTYTLQKPLITVGWHSATQQNTIRNITRRLRSLVSLLSAWKDPDHYTAFKDPCKSLEGLKLS